jgi:hypothetical protein
MKAVAAFAANPKFLAMQNQAGLVAEGLGELANNGIMAGGVALLFGVAALVLRRRPTPANA